MIYIYWILCLACVHKSRIRIQNLFSKYTTGNKKTIENKNEESQLSFNTELFHLFSFFPTFVGQFFQTITTCKPSKNMYTYKGHYFDPSATGNPLTTADYWRKTPSKNEIGRLGRKLLIPHPQSDRLPLINGGDTTQYYHLNLKLDW